MVKSQGAYKNKIKNMEETFYLVLYFEDTLSGKTRFTVSEFDVCWCVTHKPE